MTRYTDRGAAAVVVGVLAVLAVIVALFAVVFVAERATAKTETITVSSKAIMPTKHGGHQYMIYGTNGQAYKDVDSWAFFKFDSSNVYAQLQAHHTYTCEVSGFRVAFLSMYNNIIHCTELKH